MGIDQAGGRTGGVPPSEDATGWRRLFAGRPHWMNALMLFCAYMALFYVPWDFLVKPAAEDAEVWFGIVLRGFWAKATEPLHWAIYAAGAWGFWRMRSWMWPWASVYVAQIAIAMFVWALTHYGGWRGSALGVASAVPFIVLAVALYRARDRFRGNETRS